MSHPSPTDHEHLMQAIRHYNEGDLASAGRLAQALYALNPQNAEAIHLLGLIASRSERLDLAARLLSLAIDLKPQQPQYRLHLGELYGKLGNQEAAEAQYRQAIRLKPDLIHAHVNLGNLFFAQDDYEQAKAAYQTAIRLEPKTYAACYNMGIIAQEEGDHDSALEFFAQALQSLPDSALTHTARAFSLLTLGRFQEGWSAYEWRWRLPNNAPRRCEQPLWDGSDPKGKRIYLYTEQGFGDALLFVRYLKRLRERGGFVILECKPELFALFQTARLADMLVARAADDDRPPTFDFDLHLPLLSLLTLPGFFTGPNPTLPESVPYLQADPALVAVWRERLAALPGLRVALCWSGNPKTAVNRHRACTFDAFLPLLQVPGISFISIQKGPPAQQMRSHTAASTLWDLDEQLTDFAQTAAVLTQVDLLISTDTAVVHLAGGLGRPVWTLLHTAAEWRWMQNRLDSPWYPGMRLFRQASRGDWDGLIAQVAAALHQWCCQTPPGER